jgi:hypothetical protein
MLWELMVEGPKMSDRDAVWQERRLEEILFSNTDPVSTQAPVYYERLDFAELDDEPAVLDAEPANPVEKPAFHTEDSVEKPKDTN